MDLYEMIGQVEALLKEHGRLSYRAVKYQFHLDDEGLAALKEELIDIKEIATDKDGKMLIWTGGTPVSSLQSLAPNPQPPINYTPAHLAERIRAVAFTEGERKTITALFADMAGFTALAQDLDPEDTRAIVDPALQIMMDAVHRYEGFVTQSLGDGIFALFGAPIAHEDHPHRALYAALLMQEEMRRYADRMRLEKGVPPIQIRVGINTGEVVLRSIRKDDLHTDYVPVGHSTNLASRMEGLATPGSIVVSEHTYKLIEGYFACKALGAAQVKGIEQPVPVYEVLAMGPLKTRLQVAMRRGLTRFVGRQGELEQMKKALALTKVGHGQIVGVMGEPGVGKSRLFYEFKLTSQSGCLVLEAFSVSHGKAAAYLPLIELLKNYFQITLQDDERQRQEKVTGKVLTLDRSLEDILPYLFALLGITDATAALQQMDPQMRRRRTLDAIKRLLIRESLKQPLIVIFEDLHWLDTETQAFLDLLSESVATAKILLLVNYRPEYRHEWSNKTYYTQLRIDPLGKEDAEEMLTVLLGEHRSPLPERERPALSPVEGDRVRVMQDDLHALKRFILEKTEGNPFFMEEVVQTLVEEKVLVGERGRYRLEKPLTALHIPLTVQGVLAARIDRLTAEEKGLLQTLSVIGREFALSLLRQVVEQPEEELYRLLSHLQGSEFIYEQPAFPEVEYIFKHALTQEVAYNSLLVERRKVLHERTARAIETLYSASLEDHYSELAHHYSRSENTEKAVKYLGLAGQQAAYRSANAEAITRLTAALDLLKTLPSAPERIEQELMLQVALGTPLMETKGYAAPEAKRAYTRALELCRQMGETPQIFPVLRGLWAFYTVRGEIRLALKLTEQLLTLAQRTQDPALLLEAHVASAVDLLWQGEAALAIEHMQQGMALYDPQHHRSHAVLYGFEPGVTCLCYTAMALWFLGYPDQALRKSHEALTLAQGQSHPASLAMALNHGATVHKWRREVQAAQEQMETEIALCREQGLAFWLALATIFQGWALAEQGQGEEGIAQMHQGWATYLATGSGAWVSTLALFAEAYGKAGQIEEGLATLVKAQEKTRTTGERFYEAELYRLKGQLTLQKFRVSSFEFQVLSSPQPLTPSTQAEVEQEAEECFLKAIKIARRQQAKSWELRAATSLARLWQGQGKKEEARQMLAEVYGWFTEGFDMADLTEARTLLEELTQS